MAYHGEELHVIALVNSRVNLLKTKTDKPSACRCRCAYLVTPGGDIGEKIKSKKIDLNNDGRWTW
ncbi:MAG: hypothetical protein K9M11_03355 [Candidatus Pacebacteria bacterium]|nr:hypothetical protein [Candidatus Paceibacterota bacterium]